MTLGWKSFNGLSLLAFAALIAMILPNLSESLPITQEVTRTAHSQKAVASNKPSSVQSKHDLIMERMKSLYGASTPDDVTFVNRDDVIGAEAGSSKVKGGLRTMESTGKGSSGMEASYTGDVATGVILLEEKGELDLDTRPCKGRVYTFHPPYKKKERGKVTCDGKEFQQYSVEQK